MRVKTGLKAGNTGLGDVVADVTSLTGIDRLAKMYEEITGKPCGCEERREKLNLLVPLPTGRS